jgi:hypothetical protein
MTETREQLKSRIFSKLETVFENHLDYIQINDEESEGIYCEHADCEKCLEPQQLTSCPKTRTLTIEIAYVSQVRG